MSIPVKNIYYLLCYAWNHVQELERIDAGGEQFNRLADMLGHVLAGAVAGLLKSGLDRDYVEQKTAIPGIRGKLELPHTIRRQLTMNGRTYCRFDEFNHDTLQNQIIKSTIAAFLTLRRLHTDVRAELRGVMLHMRDVTDIRVQRRDFARVRIHRNNRGYDFVLRLCQLVHESLLVESADGVVAFYDFRDDEARMGKLFEDFLFNFFRREQRACRVDRPHINWYEATGSPRDLERLPIMRTDIVLRRRGAVLIIDAKYYKQALTTQFHREKVRAAHLYQIFAYLENLRPTVSEQIEGMLLYPVVSESFMYDYRLHGHRIRVAAINLDQDWPQIRDDLLRLVA